MKASIALITFALCLATQVAALGTRKGLHHEAIYGKGPEIEARIKEEVKNYRGVGVAPDPQDFNHTTLVDHFNASNKDTYPMRYIIDYSYYNNVSGPILFYAGNEGSIWTFYNNTGFMAQTLAQELGALVVFAEHRYYGTSLPYGENAFDRENLRFLTIEQVMLDYVSLLDYIKNDLTFYPELKDRATILFGGSYGGMLASWMRMKYPQHFQGALASSAPILWFQGMTDPNAYTKVVSDTIRNMGGQECYDYMSRGFYDLRNMQYDFSKWASVQSIFNLCDTPSSPDDIETLIGILSDSLGTEAMVNYPYATSFINDLPAWPLNASCTAAKTMPSQPFQDVSMYNFTNIEALQRAANVFYNYTGTNECLNISESQAGGLDDNGWEIQTCNEFPMPMGDDPSQSCFTWVNWDQEAFTSECMKNYGMNPQYNWALDYFGGRNPGKDFAASSNIIFSNGELDPWHAGGVLEDVFVNNEVIWIKNAAHHLDLRLPNEADPVQVVEARNKERALIKQWVEEYQNQVIELNA